MLFLRSRPRAESPHHLWQHSSPGQRPGCRRSDPFLKRAWDRSLPEIWWRT